MRRSHQPAPLSPKVIKHFAVATLAITGLLAMFASGEDTQVQAAIKARQAKNQLAETQAKKLGATKLGSSIKPEDRSSYGAGYEQINEREAPVTNPGDLPRVDSGGGGGSWMPPASYQPQLSGADHPPLPFGPPRNKQMSRKSAKKQLTAEELAEIRRAAANRTGTASGD